MEGVDGLLYHCCVIFHLISILVVALVICIHEFGGQSFRSSTIEGVHLFNHIPPE